MTYTFEKTFGKFDSSTNFEGNKLIVEYVYSSVSDCIKVVEMSRVDSEGTHFHRLNWMSKEGQASLMEDLENDMKDRMCGTGNYSIENDLELANMEADWLLKKAEIDYDI